MENKNFDNDIDIDDVLESEVDDMWDIFFPYMSENRDKKEKNETAKPSVIKPNIAMASATAANPAIATATTAKAAPATVAATSDGKPSADEPAEKSKPRRYLKFLSM